MAVPTFIDPITPALKVSKDIDELERQHIIKTHQDEREYRGFSRYDWFSFHNYLEWIIYGVCTKITVNQIKVKGHVARYSANEIIRLLEQSDEIKQRIEALIQSTPTLITETNPHFLREDERAVFDKGSALENEVFALRLKAVSMFFDNVFIALPYSEDTYYVPMPTGTPGRADAGFNHDDYLVIRSYLSSIIVAGMNMFASPLSSAYAGESPQEWAEILFSISTALGHLQHAGEPFSSPESDATEWEQERWKAWTTGMYNLKKYFFDLWD